MILASSYKMLFVGPEDVCFVKKKKKEKGIFTSWLSMLSFLYKHYCSVHVVTLAL